MTRLNICFTHLFQSKKYIKPHKVILVSILMELPGDDPPPEILGPCALSVIGQCIYYALGAPVIRRISEDSSPTEENLDRLAAFVWLFSLGGIERIKADR